MVGWLSSTKWVHILLAQVILAILVKAEAFPRMPLLHHLPAWDLVSFLWQSCIHSAHRTTPLIIPNKKRQLFPLVTRKRETIAWTVWFWDFLWRWAIELSCTDSIMNLNLEGSVGDCSQHSVFFRIEEKFLLQGESTLKLISKVEFLLSVAEPWFKQTYLVWIHLGASHRVRRWVQR